MQLSNLSRSESLKLQKLTLPIRMYKLINAHKPTTDPHHQLIVHNLRIDLLSSKHVEAAAQSRNRQLHSGLVDILSQHLIHNVALDCPISYLCRISGPNLLHLR